MIGAAFRLCRAALGDLLATPSRIWVRETATPATRPSGGPSAAFLYHPDPDPAHAPRPVGVSNAEDCHRCGSHNPSWSAPSPLWNAVMRGGSINGPALWGDMVCPTCFVVLAEEAGIAQGWRLEADVVHVELEMTTPSGRTWDPARRLWVEPLEGGGLP